MSEVDKFRQEDPATFQKAIRIGNSSDIVGSEDPTNDNSSDSYGTIRYNTTTNRFQGLHKSAGAGPFGETWRNFGIDMASETTLGGIKVGTNLLINSTTGVLTSVTAGQSRIYQQIITVSDNTGAGDFDTISDAISNALGSAPNYNDGSVTTSNGAPSLTNQYIIRVSPGVYREQVNLPNFVSLVGSGINRTYIKSSRGGNSVSNGALITMAPTSSVENMTLQLDSYGEAYVVGTYSASNSNIAIQSVEIVDTGNSSTTATYGSYISGGSGHKIQNTDYVFTLGTSNIYGGYIYNSSIRADDIHTNITSGATHAHGLLLENSTDNEIKNSRINVSGSTNNYGIYHIDSSSDIRYSRVELDGDTDDNNDNSIAVVANAQSKSASITSTVIKFISNTTGKDVIHLTNTSSNNFVTDGFKDGMQIVVSGASNTLNNNYFTIDQVSSDTLTLALNDTLTNESAGQSVTIKQLFNINIDNSILKATSNVSTSNTVSVLRNNGNYAIDLNTTQLIGGVINSNSNKVDFAYPQVITVSRRGGDFYLLSDAINSIVDSSSTKRYIINVQPGNYTETSAITCKEYVNIIGSGSKNTIINFDIASSTLSSAAALILASNMEISGIQIKNTTATATSSSIGMYGINKDDININKCQVDISGTARTKYAVYLDNCSYQSHYNEFNTSAGASSINNYGIYQTSCDGVNETSNITVSGDSSTLNIGIYNQDTNLQILDPTINVSGGSGVNKGISAESSGVTDYMIQIFNGEILSSDTNNNSLIIEDDNYTIVANGCRLGGDISYTETNTDCRIYCINCYQVSGTGSLTYNSINLRGENEASNNNLTLGDTAGKQGMTGTDNILIGVNTGTSLTTGSRNVFLGSRVGESNTIGDDNTFIGYATGNVNVSGDYNTFVGSSAGTKCLTGIKNTLIGSNAGHSITTGNYNTAVGETAAYKITTGSGSVMVGEGSGFSNTTGSRNVFIGGGDSSNVGAGYSNSVANDNTYVGYQAGKTATANTDNTMMGSKAGFSNVGADNTFIGSNAGYHASTGTENVIIGKNASFGSSGNTTGSDNTIVGSNAGVSLTSGGFNVLMGRGAGYSTTTGQRNIMIGSTSTTSGSDAAGYANTTGDDNIIIGSKAGKTATSSNNLLVGTETGTAITSGTRNVMLGHGAGKSGTGFSDNLFIGYEAGRDATISDSVMIGSYAGKEASTDGSNTPDKSVFIGNYSGFNTVGKHNTFIGYDAGRGDNATGGNAQAAYNVAIGTFVGRKLDTGLRNILIGSGDTTSSTAGALLTSGDDNILMGYKSGKNISSGSKNIIIGTETAQSLASSDGNLIMGYQAGNSTTGEKNILLGYQAGYAQTSADYNIFMGYESGKLNTTSDYNIGIGYQSGYTNSSDGKNISIGYQSSYNTTGDTNMSIGYRSGYANTSGSNNIFMGYQSGGKSGISHTASNNLFIGNESGYSTTNGGLNIFMGNKAGYSNASGAKNIIMGNYAGYSSEGSQNILIGATDYATTGIGHNTTGSYNLFMGSNVGIINTSGANNIFMGRHSGAFNDSGDENINIGYSSGYSGTTGSDNVNVGYNTGKYNETGSYNIYLGYKSGVSDSTYFTGGKDRTKSYNISIGYQSGTRNQNDKLIFMGYKAGELNTSGGDNIFVGTEAGKLNTTGSRNIFVGTDAGKSNLTGEDNTIVGSEAGVSTISSDNIMIGSYSGYANTSGTRNVIIGTNAVKSGGGNNIVAIGSNSAVNTTGTDNIFIGASSGESNTTGINNVAIGTNAVKSGGGNNIVAIGSNSAVNTTGADNIFIGASSGESNTTGINNVVIGTNAMINGIASNVIVIGRNAGRVNEIDNNIFVGNEAGKSNTTGDNNIFFGSNAGASITTGNTNIYVGSNVGSVSTTSNDNIVMGNSAFTHGTTANGQILIGNYSGYSLTSNEAYDNIYVGNYSGYKSTTAHRNLFIGWKAGYETTTGNYNTLIGHTAGWNITTGTNNIVCGSFCGLEMTTQSNNILIGSGAGRNVGTNDNIMIGTSAGNNTTTGTENIFVGSQCFNTNLNGNTNIGIGANAGQNNISGEKNLFIGKNSGLSNTTGNNNVCIGYLASNSSVTASNIVAIGYYSGYSNTVDDGIFIGTETGKNTTTGLSNMFVGNKSGSLNVSGDYNTCFGYFAGYRHQISNGNVFMGTAAGEGLSSFDYAYSGSGGIKNINFGNYNIALGYLSGQKITQGYGNTILGYQSATELTTGFHNNAMGPNSAYNLTTGDYNTMIGDFSGYNTTTTNDNVYIGTYSGFANETGEKNISIGSDTLYNTRCSQSVALGYRANFNGGVDQYYTKNTYIGYQSGYANTGSNNIFITGGGSTTSTSFDNSFIVYKDEIHNGTLIYGSFSNNCVGINTSDLTLAPSNTAAKLIVDGGVLATTFAPFTGTHIINISNLNGIESGMILSSTGQVVKGGLLNVIMSVELSSVAEDKRVLGVYEGTYTENFETDNIGNKYLTRDVVYGKRYEYVPLSNGLQKTKVVTDNITDIVDRTPYFEIYTLQETYDNPNYDPNQNIQTTHKVASLGEGCIWVTDYNGNIENGDYITTSVISGFGMKQNNTTLHNYTVAKCTETIDWTTITDTITYNSTSYKKYLIGCTYHSG